MENILIWYLFYTQEYTCLIKPKIGRNRGYRLGLMMGFRSGLKLRIKFLSVASWIECKVVHFISQLKVLNINSVIKLIRWHQSETRVTGIPYHQMQTVGVLILLGFLYKFYPTTEKYCICLISSKSSKMGLQVGTKCRAWCDSR